MKITLLVFVLLLNTVNVTKGQSVRDDEKVVKSIAGNILDNTTYDFFKEIPLLPQRPTVLHH